MGLRYLDRGNTKTNMYFTDEDNQKCIELLTAWRTHRLQDLENAKRLTQQAEQRGEKTERGMIVKMSVPVPDFVAAKILEICERTSTRYNYHNYPFREDMVSEATTNAIRYLHTFDPTKIGERSQKVNFHAWVTRTIEGVFGGYIHNEKAHDYKKNISLLHSPLVSEMFDSNNSSNSEALLTNQQIYNDFVDRASEFEEKLTERAQRAKDRAAAKAPEPEEKASNALF